MRKRSKKCTFTGGQFLKTTTAKFELKTEGPKGFEESHYKNTFAAGPNKRKHTSSEEQNAHMACEQ